MSSVDFSAVKSLLSDILTPPLSQAAPGLVRIRRSTTHPALVDVELATAHALDALNPTIAPRARIAITAGSRGITDLPAVLRAAGAWLRARGADPFVVPAMGSHGGGTVPGQLAVLADLGVTESLVGMPIEATIDTVVVGTTASGVNVHLDAVAAGADGILAVNRIKPHTDFGGPDGSGVAKILAVGLGNGAGADAIHAAGAIQLPTTIREVASYLQERVKVIGALAIVENEEHRAESVTSLATGELGGPAELTLCARARAIMARLPFDSCDVLVVDDFGKNRSGSGLDTNVIGRMDISGIAEPASPAINVIVALAVSSESHGNAIGIGLADIVTARVTGALDLRATYLNALTSKLGGIRRVRIPMVMGNDEDAVGAAIRCCPAMPTAALKIARIHNTLDLSEMLVAPALVDVSTASGTYARVGDHEDSWATDAGMLRPW